MKVLKVEKTASSGIAMGKAYVVKQEELVPDLEEISENQIEDEIKRYEHVVEMVKKDLIPLSEKNEIFAAHLELVQDIALHDGVKEKIETGHLNAELALCETVEDFAVIFQSMDNEYMRERAADLFDIKNRLLRKMKGLPETGFDGIHEQVVIVAKDLAPSDTAKLDLKYMQGFLTECGGVTSHVSIMAKGMGIPALVGVKDLLEQIQSGDDVIVDAAEGIVYINPEKEVKQKYIREKNEYEQKRKQLLEISGLPAVTEDGRTVEICANVGNLEDIQNALKFSVDGIGLFRSEFLYMENDHFPTEEEQYEVYKKAAECMGEKELTIRTLDIGGDKGLSYFEFPKEENPFLGYRAIRIGLDKTEILKTQLKALLRAGISGRIRIMYPMIVSVEELKQANRLLEECRNELKVEGKAFAEKIEVGIMVETPAAVMMAEELAKYADFFSIGTNDLTQYVLAVDRGNEKISQMYDSFHPAVLRAIHQIIEAGHKEGIKVGMCGEFASNLKAVPILLGMGLDEFSMSAGSAPEVKYEIRSSHYERARELVGKVIRQETIAGVVQCIS